MSDPRRHPPTGSVAGVRERVALLVATVFGSGLSPLAPGTAGSLVAALLYLPLRGMFAGPVPWPGLALVLATCLLGVWAAGIAEARSRRKDPGLVVIDEVAGQWITYLGLSFSWWTWGLGFLLFRLFDILKPFPARRLERLPGGWGIMLDDLVAGVYARLALVALARWVLP